MGKRKQLSLSWDKQGELTIIAPSSGSTKKKQARLRIRVTKEPMKRNKTKEEVAQQGEKTTKKQQQQLYVVVDDWAKGYSIHKVVDDVETLGDPPLLRLEASNGSRDPRFVALGGGSKKLLALWQPRNVPTRATVYDVETGGVMADGPLLPGELHHVCSVAAGGGRLHALHAGGLDSLEEVPSADLKPQWKWTGARTPPPLFGTLPNHNPIDIMSYALHPDGRTFFVSARVWGGHAGTFSLDTTSGGEWRRHGEWLLPFFGQGHYDSTLDAWVGFHSPGHLCACHVPPMITGGEQTTLEWTLIQAKDLFVTDPEDNVFRKSLMTMACLGNAKFCILEPVTTTGADLSWSGLEVLGGKYVLRLTRFRLKRNRCGQLRPSSRRLVRSYSLRKYDSIFAPRAFLI